MIHLHTDSTKFSVQCAHFLVMPGVLLKYICDCRTIKTGNSTHYGPRNQIQTLLLVVHPTSQYIFWNV